MTRCIIGTVKDWLEPATNICRVSSAVPVSNSLRDSLFSSKRVQGLTHNFYRYPARFSAEFARQVVLAFTKPYDCVLDPFVGGGTTLVESLALGRRAIGIDVNSLAYFVSLVKTTPLSSNDVESILAWADEVAKLDSARVSGDALSQDDSFANVPREVVGFLTEASRMAGELRFPRQRRFARCAILRVGQLSLDCQSSMPSVAETKTTFERLIRNMLIGLNEFVSMARSNNVPKHKITSMRHLFVGSAADSIVEKVQSLNTAKPTLVLTSPPYPQIHVLYNKWQILGRRETADHYRLAELKDGNGPSFYTMGGRSQKGLDDYFQKLSQAFESLRRAVSPEAVIVQLVAFPDEEALRARYLSMMDLAGFQSFDLSSTGALDPVTRTVPNRRWYACYHEKQCSSRETLMIHQVRK